MKLSFKILLISLVGYFCLTGLFACQDDDSEGKPVVEERDSLPWLKSLGVSTIISDSGIIRYKIISEDWYMYDKREPQFWAFEKGLFLEKFDENYHVEAFINCDTAYYYNNDKLWELRGRVCVKNLKGETFKTSLLYWDQASHTIYSPAYMVIDGIEQDLEGYDFNSNESMTEYMIHASSGAFPLGEEKRTPQPSAEDAVRFQATDSIQIKE